MAKQYIEKYHKRPSAVTKIKSLIAKYPTIKDVKNPIIGKLLNDCSINKSLDLTMQEPRIAGIERKKENLVASFDFKPSKRATEIVIPDLEIPGNTAKHCMQPIIKAICQFKHLSSVFKSLVDKRMNPVIIIQ
tara:strand:+ start:75 stop:473 length:399 start_codon:yes stop_codon:yes gene_type:complete